MLAPPRPTPIPSESVRHPGTGGEKTSLRGAPSSPLPVPPSSFPTNSPRPDCPRYFLPLLAPRRLRLSSDPFQGGDVDRFPPRYLLDVLRTRRTGKILFGRHSTPHIIDKEPKARDIEDFAGAVVPPTHPGCLPSASPRDLLQTPKPRPHPDLLNQNL